MLRREFLAQSAAFATVMAVGSSANAHGLFGTADAQLEEYGIRRNSTDDQSAEFRRLLRDAAKRDLPVMLSAGRFRMADIQLPPDIALIGIPGLTIIEFSGGDFLMRASDSGAVRFDGITFDGGQSAVADDLQGLLHLERCSDVSLSNCVFARSAGCGVSLIACGGSVRDCRIEAVSRACGLYALDSAGLTISGNSVRDCADGGILIHRSKKGEDNTIVSNNRVEKIRAASGGTGQFGNGINLFRAGGVIVSNNHVTDCAFSGIRANSADNAQMSGNSILRSGETALYAEFSFEGSVITGNLIDGAANGISIANFNEGGRLAVCSNNLVRNLRTDAPYRSDVGGFGTGIYAEADTALTGNVIENAPSFGILLGWGAYLRHVTASHNIIRNAGHGVGVSVDDGIGKAAVTDNMISGSSHGAIVGHDRETIVTGDLALQQTTHPALTIEDNIIN